MARVNSCQATKRIFLLCDGIDYDSTISRGFGPNEVRQVAVDDMWARELVMQVTRFAQASGGYTNDPTMKQK
jgi:hypothetical protein